MREREALRGVLDSVLRRFHRSIHLVCGHVIDELGPDTAHGTTYCRAEQEAGDRWMVSVLMYDDEYARVDGRWLFVRRVPQTWYHADMLERPSAVGLHNWPEMTRFGITLPGGFPTWAAFWAGPGPPREVTRRRTVSGGTIARPGSALTEQFTGPDPQVSAPGASRRSGRAERPGRRLHRRHRPGREGREPDHQRRVPWIIEDLHPAMMSRYRLAIYRLLSCR